VNGSVSYIVTAEVYTSATGYLNNTASIKTNYNETITTDNADTDSDLLTPVVDFVLTKVDGGVVVDAGSYVTYTIQVTNNGPSDARTACVVDNFSSLLTNVSWTCSGLSGGSCATGTNFGNILDTAASIPYKSTIRYVVTAQVYSSVSPGSNVTNWASVFPLGGATATTPTTNDLSSTITFISVKADLSVTKTDGSTTATPGTNVVYTITVTNNGPSDSSVSTVTDLFPSAYLYNVNWGCTATGGAQCNGASGSGNIVATNVNLPAKGAVTFQVTGTIYGNQTGNLTNTVTVSTNANDTNSGNDYSMDSDLLIPSAALNVTKTDGQTTVVAGTTTSLIYTIDVKNLGPSAIIDSSASITDTFSSSFIQSVSWECLGAGCGAPGPFATNPLQDKHIVLAVGESITYQVRSNTIITNNGRANLIIATF